MRACPTKRGVVPPDVLLDLAPAHPYGSSASTAAACLQCTHARTHRPGRTSGIVASAASEPAAPAHRATRVPTAVQYPNGQVVSPVPRRDHSCRDPRPAGPGARTAPAGQPRRSAKKPVELEITYLLTVSFYLLLALVACGSSLYNAVVSSVFFLTCHMRLSWNVRTVSPASGLQTAPAHGHEAPRRLRHAPRHGRVEANGVETHGHELDPLLERRHRWRA